MALATPAGEVMRSGTVRDVVYGGGHLHGYRIEWDDGHVALFSPSARGLVPMEAEGGEEVSAA